MSEIREEKEILDKIIEIFQKAVEVDVAPDSELIYDLELSSIDIFVLLVELEEQFGIKIPESYVREMGCIQDVADIISLLLSKKKK